MGFEAVFIDSAKHIGGYDMANYTGVGALPEYEQMQYILMEIRRRSGVTSISFAGEKSTGDLKGIKILDLQPEQHLYLLIITIRSDAGLKNLNTIRSMRPG